MGKSAKRHIYLDHNATTPLHPGVRKAMVKAMDVFGNPSSVHYFGRKARRHIEESRESIASFIGSQPDEIIFVSSGSEANNTVLNLFACPSRHCLIGREGRREVITTKIEHPCVLETSHCLEDRGVKFLYLDVDSFGKVDMGQLKNLISRKTALVSVMYANNEMGTIQNIKEISRTVHEKGAYMHTDAVQAVGKIPLDVQDLDVDYLSFSAHKIYGPKGVGGLYVKKGSPFCPFVRGGHQERGRRAGTENTLGIIAMAEAIKFRELEMYEEEERLLRLKQYLKKAIINNIPDVKINGHPVDCLAGTLNVSFRGVEGESLLLYLDIEGIAVSTGSACSSGSLEPSHVLLAAGNSPELAHGSIRMSLGRETRKEDIDYVVDKLINIVNKLRAMSTAYHV